MSDPDESEVDDKDEDAKDPSYGNESPEELALKLKRSAAAKKDAETKRRKQLEAQMKEQKEEGKKSRLSAAIKEELKKAKELAEQ